MSSGDLHLGMTKKQFCLEVNTFKFDHDPCKLRGVKQHFPNTNKEIFSDATNKIFFVFSGVTKPHNHGKGTFLIDYGNGYLEKIFYNYSEAKSFASKIQIIKKKEEAKKTNKKATKVTALGSLIDDYEKGKISKKEFEKRKKILIND